MYRISKTNFSNMINTRKSISKYIKITLEDKKKKNLESSQRERHITYKRIPI